MSYTKIMVHCVWGTKNHIPILLIEKRLELFAHIKQNARSKEIFIDIINGHTNHVHCLISLGAEQSISKVIQLIKGESSYWANKMNLFPNKLVWAEDYFAASVSESALNKVRDYIKNQEEHHKKLTFIDEYENFIKSYNFQPI